MGPFNAWTIVGAVALFLFQQVANWLLKDWLDRHKDQIKRALNFKLAIALFDLAVMVGIIWLAFDLFNNTKPAYRQDLLLAVGMQTMLIVVFLNFIDDLRLWVLASRAQAAPEQIKP